jgi:cytidine deaminase
MASIDVITGHNAGKAEYKIQLSKTACGRNFMFTLHGNHIEVEPREIDTKDGKSRLAWHEALNEEETLKIFNKILAQYRKRSLGAGGFKLACLGITEQGKLYISENTEQLSSDFYRQCAEQNMVTISTQRDVYDQISRRLREGGDPDSIKPQNPKYRSVYLMGGKLPEFITAAPCGNCTDLLAKVMMPDANIWILPVNDGSKQLQIRDDIEFTDQLKKDEAWKTNIDHLNRERSIQLPSDTAARLQEQMTLALAETPKFLRYYGEEDPNHAMGKRNGNDFDPDTHAGRILLEKMSNDDMIDLGKLKAYMRDQIMTTLANRLEALARKQGLGSIADLSEEQIGSIATKDSSSAIRCVVVQRDDGRLYASVNAKSAVDKSSVDPEIAALTNAGSKLGTQGIRQCWVMEFDLRNADHDQIKTSPKTAVERLIKRPSVVTGRVDFGYFPFDLEVRTHEQAAEDLIRRSDRQLSPGYHTGKAKIGFSLGNQGAFRV